MLHLLAAAVLSQAPIYVQALVPTSGANADALLDGKADTGWTPEGDAEGEGVLFRFDGEVSVTRVVVQACPGKQVTVTPFVNGNDWRSKTVNDKPSPIITSASPRPIRSFFLRVDRQGPACLAEVSFETDKPLQVRAPRSVKATAKASSVLAPADAYHPGYLFDGRLDFGWVEGVKGPGLGESMTLTFEQPVTITAVELWNGYQRSDDHFVKNARAKKVSIAVDGAEPVELAVADKQGPQKLALAKPATTKTLTLTIREAYPGKKYDDLVLSELRLWDAEGPRTISTGDLAERATELKDQVKSTPLAAFIDTNFRSICEVEGRELEAKFRSNHSFVVYRSSDEDTGAVKEVIDGTWITKDGKSVELFARSHRTETSNDPYASPAGKVSTTITGGALTVTRVADLDKGAYDKLLARLMKSPAKWSLDCDLSRQFDALAKQGAFVVEGRAVTAILKR